MKIVRAALAFSACLMCSSVLAQMQNFAQMPDMPKRKPGLWESQMKADGMPLSKHCKPGQPCPVANGMTTRECVDEKSEAERAQRMREMAKMTNDRKGPDQAQAEKDCKQSSKKTATGWEGESVCKKPEGTQSLHSVVTLDAQGNSKTDIVVRFDPPKDGVSEARMHSTQRYLGACPADMQPGEMLIDAGAGFMPAINPAKMPSEAEIKKMRKRMEQMKQAQ